MLVEGPGTDSQAFSNQAFSNSISITIPLIVKYEETGKVEIGKATLLYNILCFAHT
jgi:hypothetical protein